MSPRKSTLSGRSYTPKRPSRSPIKAPLGEVDRLHVESSAPPRFICPISGRVMRDPIIILVTGTSCDNGSFERWLAKGNQQDPVTKTLLHKPINTTPNVELRKEITRWARIHAGWLVDQTNGDLVPNQPRASELQGIDPQYVRVIVDESKPRTRPSSRMDSRGQGSKPDDTKQVTAMVFAGKHATAAWTAQSAKSVSGSTPKPGGVRSIQTQGCPNLFSGSFFVLVKQFIVKCPQFLALLTFAHLGLLLATFGLGDWKASSMRVNPWYGGSAGALAQVGALALPLLQSPASQWWRLLSSPFVPAGVIHFAVAVVGLWTFGLQAHKALPLPTISVPATYLLSAAFGMLLSINLNSLFIVCGAWSGMSGLLGCLVADQFNMLTKWKERNSSWNGKQWWLTSLMLIVCAAALLTFSVLPMVGLWGTLGGLWMGIMFTVPLLLIPRVRKSQRPEVRGWRVLQGCAFLLMLGSFAAVILGAALPNKLGQKSLPFLQGASCSTFGGTAWECTPLGYLPSGCGITIIKNTSSSTAVARQTARITCAPSATSTTVPLLRSSPALLMNETALQLLCERHCSNATSPIPGPRYKNGTQPTRFPPTLPLVSPQPLLIPVESLLPPVPPPLYPSPSPSPWPIPSVSRIQAGRKLHAGANEAILKW